MDIIEQVHSLQLPMGQYTVIGSGILSALGIRPHEDIDLLVTRELYDQFKIEGWEENEIVPGFFVVKKGNVEASPDMVSIPGYMPNLKKLIKDAQMISGVPFMSLEELVKFKTALGREKDQKDIKLIDEYKKKSGSI